MNPWIKSVLCLAGGLGLVVYANHRNQPPPAPPMTTHEKELADWAAKNRALPNNGYPSECGADCQDHFEWFLRGQR